MWKKQVTQITKRKQRIQIFNDYGLMPKHTASHKPFCLTDDFQVTVPSCSSVRSSWIRSSLRNSWPSFSRTTDFGSRRRLISLSRAAFSYSLTRSFTWEMASLIISRPCTRDLSSSVSAATRHRGRDVVKQQLLHSCISEGSQSVLVVWRLRQNWAFCTRGNQTTSRLQDQLNLLPLHAQRWKNWSSWTFSQIMMLYRLCSGWFSPPGWDILWCAESPRENTRGFPTFAPVLADLFSVRHKGVCFVFSLQSFSSLHILHYFKINITASLS